MALRKTFRPNTSHRGFTLIELLVVIGMLAIVGSFTLVVGMRQLAGSSFHNDRDTLIATLQKARSQAMNEVCVGSGCTGGLPHGVHITPHQLVIFQGSTYNSSDFTNEYIDAGSNATSFGGMTDVVFAELSGNASPTGDITVTDSNGNVSTTTVESEGQIRWSN